MEKGERILVRYRGQRQVVKAGPSPAAGAESLLFGSGDMYAAGALLAL